MTFTFERYSQAENFAKRIRRHGYRAKQRGTSVHVVTDHPAQVLSVRLTAQTYSSLSAIDGRPLDNSR